MRQAGSEAGRTWHQRRAPRPALTSDLRVRTLRVRRGVLVAGKRGSCPQILSNRPGFAGKTCQVPSYLTPPARNKWYFLAGLHTLVAARGEKGVFCPGDRKNQLPGALEGCFAPGSSFVGPTGQARARREPFHRARDASSGSRRKPYIPAAVPQNWIPHLGTHFSSHPGSGAALSCARRRGPHPSLNMVYFRQD